MAWLTNPEIWNALVTLTVLEVVLGREISGRDLILMAGGFFLPGKATRESSRLLGWSVMYR